MKPANQIKKQSERKFSTQQVETKVQNSRAGGTKVPTRATVRAKLKADRPKRNR